MQKHSSTPTFNGENIFLLFKNNWRLLVVFCFIGATIAWISKLSSIPRYEISGMFQVNNKQPVNVDDFQLNGLFNNDVGKVLDSTPQSMIIMVTAASPYILNQVIEDNQLTIEVRPKLFPFIGDYTYSRLKSNSAVDFNQSFFTFPFLRASGYTWGGEHASVKEFSVPTNLREKQFTLRKDDELTYSLFYNNKLILRGAFGQSCGNANLGISLVVDEIHARPGTNFILVRHTIGRIYQSLHKNLKISEINKSQSTTDHSGVVDLGLTGTDPELQAKIINRLMELLIIKSQQDKTDSLMSMQRFINRQLGDVESNVLSAQYEVSQYRQQSNIIDLATQAKLLVTSLDDSNRLLAQNYVTRGSLENVYGPKHPLMQSLQQEEQKEQRIRQALLEQLQKLPTQEARLAELENNLSVQRNLRDTLIKRNQELQILISGQLSNVKILSYASADGVVPVGSSTKLFTIVGGVLGFIIGVFLILAAWMLRAITNPFESENACNVSVKMIIRHCKVKIKLYRKIIYNRDGYRYFSNLLRTNTLNHHEIKRMSAEILLNPDKHHVIGIVSLYPKSGAALIAHNLGRELFLAGKKVLIIQSKRFEEHELALVDIFDDKSGTLIGSEFTPVENLSVFLLNPDFNLDMYNTYLKSIVNKRYYDFDFILVLDANVTNDLSRLMNFNVCTCRYFVTTQQINSAKLQKDLDYLHHNKINVDGLFFNYNRRYFVHDLYSK